jgi:hypothetical protein
MVTLTARINKYLLQPIIKHFSRYSFVKRLLRRGRNVRRSRAESIQLNVTGSIDRSTVIAARNVMLQGRLGVRPVLFILVALVFSVVALYTSRPNHSAPPHFEKGSPTSVDFVVMPFDAVNSPASCSSFAYEVSKRAAALISGWQSTSDLKDISAGVRVWSPSQVDRLTVRVGQSYDQAVEQFASEHDADIVLYGILSCDSQAIALESYVYLSAAKRYDTSNLIGSYILDPYVNRIDLPNDNMVTADIYTWLSERARALVLLSQAIQLYNRQTSVDYLKAAHLLERLGSEVALSDEHLLSISRIFIANAYTAASVDGCSEGSDQDYLAQATNNYTLSLQHLYQPERAYLGLGMVMNSLALGESDIISAEQYLRSADNYLDSAMSAATASQNEALEWHILLTRAQSKLIEHDVTTDPLAASKSLEQAKALVTQVTDAYNSVGVVDLYQRSLAANAYLIWGDIQAYYSDDPAALIAYQKAQVIAPDSDTKVKSQAALQMAQLLTSNGDMCGALEQYRIALVNTNAACKNDKLEILQMVYVLQYSCQK